MGEASNETYTGFDVNNVTQAPEDPLYGLVAAVEADQSDKKIDLGVGAYRDNNARPWILPSVRKAKRILQDDPNSFHEYLPIAGLPDFNLAAQRLILGAKSTAISDGRVCSFQALSGTGALHLGGALLSKFLPHRPPPVYISSPSWPIHPQVFEHVHLPVKTYPYFDTATKSIDFQGMMNSLSCASPGSIIILHACAHNPTGNDPSEQQWVEIAEVMYSRKLFPFFDCAYQGFASGSLSEDSFAIRHFVDRGFQMLIAHSFAKNMGLYGERVGVLHYVASPDSKAREAVQRVASHLAILQRSELSSPPLYGARIASIILTNNQLFAEWQDDLRTMSGRIKKMRTSLRQELERLQTPGDWSFITDQIGMFSYTGFTEAHVMELRQVWHVYMALSGRISIAGLNTGNVQYFARAIHDVIDRLGPI